MMHSQKNTKLLLTNCVRHVPSNGKMMRERRIGKDK